MGRALYKPRARPHGVMFHHFRDDRHPPGQGAISAEELADLIEYVGPDRLLPAREWLSRASSGRLEPRDLCLTFDDGLLCQYDVALPVLRSFGLTAFWFVYSSVFQGGLEVLEIYRYFRTVAFANVSAFYQRFRVASAGLYPGEIAARLSTFSPSEYLGNFPFYSDEDRTFRFLRDEVLGPERYNRVMELIIADSGFVAETLRGKLWLDDHHLRRLQAEGHIVGLHSFTHPTRLENLPARVQREEYHRNAEHLASVLGVRPTTMSHPCNSYRSDTLAILRDLGITIGFCSNMGEVPGAGMLEIPRQDHANIIASMRS